MDNRYLQPHYNAAERARRAAKERQAMIADQLSCIAVEEYQPGILAHLQQMEVQTQPDVASIDLQAEIQWFMRPYLLDFLIEAHAAFRLLPETLHLAVNILDRYCSKRVVYKRHYQLVGCASLFIAAKYGDKKEKVPTVRELKAMCCQLYDDEMFIQMEWHVLQTLDWIVGHPTLDEFLQIALTTEVKADDELEHMTLYLIEMALFHKEFVSTLPSVLARSALAFARCILSRNTINHCQWAASYDPNIVCALSQRIRDPSFVLLKKYESHLLSGVSIKLGRFVDRQAMLSMAYAPPTPPSELKSTGHPYEVFTGMPQTPQKHRFALDGVLTPPITPEGDSFVPNDQRTYPNVPRLPTTPTPESNDVRSYHTTTYHFPSVHQPME
ncbi:MAG: hypothetical protein M1814_002501 [Vezdaea aestivalis]|nr:MAG: hypothetical protein M1814_002501 [Vezdaea aestivalis]